LPCMLQGDPNRLKQILLNLAGNAVKFTEHGQVVVRMTHLETGTDHASFRTDVIDSGIGIPSEAQNRLFEPYSQAESSTYRRFGGTGLGLVISRQLIELMQGTIGLESAPGRGSTFWFQLSLTRSKSSPRLLEPDHGLLRDKVIVALEAHEATRENLSNLLSSWHCRCQTVAHASELSALFSDGNRYTPLPNLFLISLNQPESEWPVLEELTRTNPALAQCPWLGLGARQADQVPESARFWRWSGLLSKPIRRAPLSRALLRLLMRDGHGSPCQNVMEPSPRLLDPKVCVAGNRSPCRILLVEDNPVNQKVALQQLRKLGYTADLATHGVEALAAMRRQYYDLVLMDCQMPLMDGFEATQRFRKDTEFLILARQRSPTRIVAMTAHSMEGDREKCLSCGMNDYVSKPVKLADLKAVIERNLASLNHQSALVSANV
jgi:two-component system, sensor histidine kinase and response regulator